MQMVEKKIKITSNALTHPGLVRTENQDNYLIQDGDGLWIIADGMGGVTNGGGASRLVCRPWLNLPHFSSLPALKEVVRNELLERNRLLYQHAELHQYESGTTVVCLLIHSQHACVMWAGDSRLYQYFYHQDRLHQITKDHTVAVENANANFQGLCLEMPSCNHLLTRAVGIEPNVKLAEVNFVLNQPQRLLLCSDGLYNELSCAEIELILAGTCTPGEACAALLQSVLDREARDNVTAMVVDIDYE